MDNFPSYNWGLTVSRPASSLLSLSSLSLTSASSTTSPHKPCSYSSLKILDKSAKATASSPLINTRLFHQLFYKLYLSKSLGIIIQRCHFDDVECVVLRCVALRCILALFFVTAPMRIPISE